MINLKAFLIVLVIAITSIVVNVLLFSQRSNVLHENKELNNWKKDAQHQLDSMADVTAAYKDTVTNDRDAAESIVVPDKPTHEVFTPVNRALPPDSASKLFSRHYGSTPR